MKTRTDALSAPEARPEARKRILFFGEAVTLLPGNCCEPVKLMQTESGPVSLSCWASRHTRRRRMPSPRSLQNIMRQAASERLSNR
jgi:hypothetical protein